MGIALGLTLLAIVVTGAVFVGGGSFYPLAIVTLALAATIAVGLIVAGVKEW